MSIRRFFLSPEKLSAAEPALTGQEATHASKVIRLKVGDALEVLDGAGRSCGCEIAAIAKHEVALRKLTEDRTPAPKNEIHLHASIIRGKAMDNLIQKATELGVHTIHPLITERGEVRLKASDWPTKKEKWMHIAIESIKQCGSRWLPIIEAPGTLQESLPNPMANAGEALSLVAALTDKTTTIRRAFEKAVRPPRQVHIWIGPEGDFTDEELRRLIDAGSHPVTLGNNVLRADTAATVAAALVLHELSAFDTLPAAVEPTKHP